MCCRTVPSSTAARVRTVIFGTMTGRGICLRSLISLASIISGFLPLPRSRIISIGLACVTSPSASMGLPICKASTVTYAPFHSDRSSDCPLELSYDLDKVIVTIHLHRVEPVLFGRIGFDAGRQQGVSFVLADLDFALEDFQLLVEVHRRHCTISVVHDDLAGGVRPFGLLAIELQGVSVDVAS